MTLGRTEALASDKKASAMIDVCTPTERIEARRALGDLSQSIAFALEEWDPLPLSHHAAELKRRWDAAWRMLAELSTLAREPQAPARPPRGLRRSNLSHDNDWRPT